jgi:hypothetical protein
MEIMQNEIPIRDFREEDAPDLERVRLYEFLSTCKDLP